MIRRFSIRRACFVLVPTIALAAAGAAFAYPDGPPDGFCGTPPLALNCSVCHGDFEVNSGNGGLELLGLPPAFQPGVLYNLTVRVQDPGQQEWGFEAAALDAANQQAGEFAVVDALRTQLSDNGGSAPDFMKQTEAGTADGTFDGPVSWSFQWLAPDTGSVDFYVAANAADASADPSGDYIYTLHITVPEATVATRSTTWTAVKSLYGRR